MPLAEPPSPPNLTASLPACAGAQAFGTIPGELRQTHPVPKAERSPKRWFSFRFPFKPEKGILMRAHTHTQTPIASCFSMANPNGWRNLRFPVDMEQFKAGCPFLDRPIRRWSNRKSAARENMFCCSQSHLNRLLGPQIARVARSESHMAVGQQYVPKMESW